MLFILSLWYLYAIYSIWYLSAECTDIVCDLPLYKSFLMQYLNVHLHNSNRYLLLATVVETYRAIERYIFLKKTSRSSDTLCTTRHTLVQSDESYQITNYLIIIKFKSAFTEYYSSVWLYYTVWLIQYEIIVYGTCPVCTTVHFVLYLNKKEVWITY